MASEFLNSSLFSAETREKCGSAKKERRRGMAIYHYHVDIFTRSKGQSAVAAAAYRSGEKIKNEYDGKTHDYSRKKGIVYQEILLPENAPKEFSDRAELWNAIEKKDKRRDSQLARSLEISLPIEFTTEEQIELIKEYTSKTFVSAGICADITIHDRADGNPHAHVMLTMRDVDENGFGGRCKSERGNAFFQKDKIHEWRKDWADMTNRRLQEKGFKQRIDHRSLEAQGVNREPKKYMGLNYSGKLRKPPL
jgi:ATP-dependent exoDNAse (exonuclease V) alpha subunit